MYDYNKTTWLNPNIDYLFNNEIIEYDISDAGFNIIKQFKLLPLATIQRLELMNKGISRHIAIGTMQRDDKEFSKALINKFAEVRRVFMQENNIVDNDIISVKKDAFFITKQPQKTKFGLINFRPKNKYDSYIKFHTINNMEVYYNSTSKEIDIKGMSDVSINKHRLYSIYTLKQIMDLIEANDRLSKIKMMKFIDKYKFDKLPEEYYLEFNNNSSEINKLFNFQNLWIPLLFIIRKEVL